MYMYMYMYHHGRACGRSQDTRVSSYSVTPVRSTVASGWPWCLPIHVCVGIHCLYITCPFPL